MGGPQTGKRSTVRVILSESLNELYQPSGSWAGCVYLYIVCPGLISPYFCESPLCILYEFTSVPHS